MDPYVRIRTQKYFFELACRLLSAAIVGSSLGLRIKDDDDDDECDECDFEAELSLPAETAREAGALILLRKSKTVPLFSGFSSGFFSTLAFFVLRKSTIERSRIG